MERKGCRNDANPCRELAHASAVLSPSRPPPRLTRRAWINETVFFMCSGASTTSRTFWRASGSSTKRPRITSSGRERATTPGRTASPSRRRTRCRSEDVAAPGRGVGTRAAPFRWPPFCCDLGGMRGGEEENTSLGVLAAWVVLHRPPGTAGQKSEVPAPALVMFFVGGGGVVVSLTSRRVAPSRAAAQEDIHELVDQEARVDQLIAHVKEQLRKLVRGLGGGDHNHGSGDERRRRESGSSAREGCRGIRRNSSNVLAVCEIHGPEKARRSNRGRVGRRWEADTEQILPLTPYARKPHLVARHCRTRRVFFREGRFCFLVVTAPTWYLPAASILSYTLPLPLPPLTLTSIHACCFRGHPCSSAERVGPALGGHVPPPA